jgi:peroxiredoxin
MIQYLNRRVFILLTLLLFYFSIFAQNYKLNFEVKGASGLNAQLAYYMGENKLIKQTGTFDKNGRLTFEGTEKLPTGIYLFIVENTGYFDLLIRNEQSFSMVSDTSDFIKKMKIKDSKENALFYEYQTKVLESKNQISDIEKYIKLHERNTDSVTILKQNKDLLEKELNQLVEKTKKQNPESYLTKILSAMDVQDFEQFNFADEELLRTPFFHNYIRLFIKKNIEKNQAYITHQTDLFLDVIKTSKANYEYIASYLLNFYNSFYKTGMNQVFVFIADNYFLPDKATWLSSKDLEQVKMRRDFLSQCLPGNKAQDLILESYSGEYLSLLQLSSKISLLYFWSVNCGHCNKSTQILKNNYTKLSSKGIEIFAINIDKDKVEWKKKIEENELPWINCCDTENISNYRDKYYVYGSPILYIIDSDKNIVALKNGETEIETAINQLLK